MKRVKLKLNGICANKLQAVKTIKEYTGLGLKESKDLIDSLTTRSVSLEFVEIVIRECDINTAKDDFAYCNLDLIYDEREKKMKRILYSDQSTCIKDLLDDVSKWDTIGIITNEDKEKLTYNQCREKAVEIIYNKYSEYIDSTFEQMYESIKDINKQEIKPVEVKIIKFNEEYGEMCAEFLKFKGYTYKEYNREEFCSEMADTLQVLLSIYSNIEEETGITLKDVLTEINFKNQKWLTKIKEYTINK